jgi:hypothetical protein
MSQVNRNFNYLTVVDGHTVWERLRVIRNFLSDRRKALKIADLKIEKFEATKDTMSIWDKKEAEILNADHDDLVNDCIDEIAFLEQLEVMLAIEAEKERVPGKTDREMYEFNFVRESQVRLVELVKSEMLSIGQITPMTMRSVMKNPSVVPQLVELKLMGDGAHELIGSAKPQVQLLLENEDNAFCL